MTEKEIEEYSRPGIVNEQLTAMKEAQETYRKQQLPPGVIAANACKFTAASDGVQAIEMLGHSMKAVSIPKDGSVSYRFNVSRHGKTMLSLAFVPTHANDRGDIRVAVSIDGAEKAVFSLKEADRSEQWKLQVLRGQALRKLELFLTYGSHTLTVKALDEHVILDQWMFDMDTERRFYSFPIASAM